MTKRPCWDEVMIDSPREVVETIVREGVQRAIFEKGRAEHNRLLERLSGLVTGEAGQALKEYEAFLNNEETEIVDYAASLGFGLAITLKSESLLADDFESILEEATLAAGLEYVPGDPLQK